MHIQPHIYIYSAEPTRSPGHIVDEQLEHQAPELMVVVIAMVVMVIVMVVMVIFMVVMVVLHRHLQFFR